MVDEYTVKLVLLGDGRAGKTSIRKRYLGEGFTTSHLMTLGASFAHKDIILERDENKNPTKKISLQIWDIGGQPNFGTIRKRFMANANAVMLVYDITRQETFMNLNGWLDELWKINKANNIPLIVIGNKIDLSKQRQVNSQQLDAYIKALKNKFPKLGYIQSIETSALTEENIEKAFELMISDIIKFLEDRKDIFNF